MSETSSRGRRARLTYERRRRLRDVARRLTIERGLNGFTVEMVCDEVGLSRRTFFNYFRSKEDAVVGVGVGFDARLVEAFVAARPPGLSGISPYLMDDLGEFAVGHFRHIGLTRAEAGTFVEVLEREPKLMMSAIAAGDEQVTWMTDIVAGREGLPACDPVARMAVVLLFAAVRVAAELFFADPSSDPFDVLLVRNLATARSLLETAALPDAADGDLMTASR